MDRVLEIKPYGKKLQVLLESGNKYIVRKKDVHDFPLYENTLINENDFCSFILKRQYRDALNDAVAMLAGRACSKKEIRDRLIRRKYMEETADLVIRKLEYENLIDDHEFCVQWIQYRMNHHYGARRIIQELKLKGIPEDIATQILNQYDQDEIFEKALYIVNKELAKSKTETDPRKSRQRIYQLLVRRGFSYDTAKHACDRAFSSVYIER